MELKNIYAGGNDDNGTKRFQAMGLIMPVKYVPYSGIWDDLKNITLLGM